MNARFPKSILVLAAAGLIGAGGAFAGNGNGSGDCDGTGICDGSSGGGNAQAQQRSHGGPADRMARMANRLGLTLEQQIQALQMFEMHAQDRDQLRAQIFGQFGGEICAQREQHRSEFRALLNEEQLALHDQAMLQQRDRAHARGGLGGIECPTD